MQTNINLILIQLILYYSFNLQKEKIYFMKTSTKTILGTVMSLLITANTFAIDEMLVASIEIGATQPILSNIEGPYTRGTAKVQLSFSNIDTGISFTNECSPSEGGYSLTFNQIGSGEGYGSPEGTAFPSGGDAGSVILIENTGTKPITKIVFKGTASNSKGGNTTLFCDVLLKDDKGVGFLLESNGSPSSGASFPTGDVCQTVSFDLTSYDIEDYDMIKSDYTYENVQAIRFTLDYIGGNSNGDVISIQAMEIYTESDGTQVGISETGTDQNLTARVSASEIIFSEQVAEMSLYSISGNKIGTAANVHSFSLEELASGVYIVKAIGQSGESLVTKIMR